MYCVHSFLFRNSYIIFCNVKTINTIEGLNKNEEIYLSVLERHSGWIFLPLTKSHYDFLKEVNQSSKSLVKLTIYFLFKKIKHCLYKPEQPHSCCLYSCLYCDYHLTGFPAAGYWCMFSESLLTVNNYVLLSGLYFILYGIRSFYCLLFQTYVCQTEYEVPPPTSNF